MYAIVTGGNAGLGLLTAQKLCTLKYKVTISVRSAEKGDEAVANIKAVVADADIDYLLMDLNDLSTVRSFAAEYMARPNPLHLLINNAGIMATPYVLTTDGFESQFQTNHLAHYLLTHLLFGKLQAADASRVINLASRAHLRWQQSLGDLTDVQAGHEASYDPWQAYGRSKTCNILMCRGLAKRFPPSPTNKISFYALHPGLVDTGLLVKAGLASNVASQAISVDDGVKTTLFLATDANVASISGRYWSDCAMVEGSEESALAQSEDEADLLWKASCRFCGIVEEQYGQSM